MTDTVSIRQGSFRSLGKAWRLSAILLATVLALVAFVSPVVADQHDQGEMASDGLSAVVQRSAFTQPHESLGHNIPDLRVSVGDAEVSCDFLSNYQSTGGLARWGYATSEVIAERTGTLTQYYQRGVVDCQERDGVWQMERRLVWDYVGGGLGEAPDLGAEPEVLSEQPGLSLGPWGHRVSNFAVDGTPTGFLDFFNALGGLQAFGLPKSDARLDETPGAELGIEDADPGVIRQYFQAAVFEHRPGSSEPVHLRFLGDDARDALYPFGSHQSFQSFKSVAPLFYGQSYVPEGTSVRDALLAIYEATGGSDWNNSYYWLSEVPLDEWYGVTTDDNGRVTELDLSQNQLTGTIPAQIGRLTDLRRLELWGNNLQGEIPPEVGSLGNLQRLSVWSNQLNGSIPAELGNLSNLRVLVGGGNQFTGSIPPELGNLTNLTYIGFTMNQLSGEIPVELANLTNLTELVFWANRLEGEIPPELANLTELTRFDFDFNRLSGEIPAEFGNLVSLESLWLRSNWLSGEIPAELGNLTALRTLGLSWNRLTGEIPADLGALENLRTVYIANNLLVGCAPAAWQEIARGDLDELDLPFCDDTEGPPA